MVVSNKDKKAQVTVFIILGIILIAVFAFLMFIVSSMQIAQLETANEEVLTKVFGKGGLQLLISECFSDELESAIMGIGTQGRFWSDQVNETLIFNEKRGTTILLGLGGLTQVYYGINYDEDLENPNSYPCKYDTTIAPYFCKFEWLPTFEGELNFGGKQQLNRFGIEDDLAKYLKQETKHCVNEYLTLDHSLSQDIVIGDVNIDLELKQTRIKIEAEYPLEFQVDGKTYLHLSNFDFIYETKLFSFLQSAVFIPIEKERENPEFEYTHENLMNDPRYSDLSVYLDSSKSNGDTIIELTLPSANIFEETPSDAEDYLFRFAIENRPPALDYISRQSCDEFYDYLVISGEEGEMGQILIDPKAIDPDGDEVNFATEVSVNEPSNIIANSNLNNLLNPQLDGTFIAEISSNAECGLYNITIKSSDFYEEDWQELRVLIDRNINVNIDLSTPLNYYDGQKLIASLEDPLFANVNVPVESCYHNINDSVFLRFTDNGDEIFEAIIPIDNVGEKCISLPYGSGQFQDCEEEDYINSINLNKWQGLLTESMLDSPHFENITNNGLMLLQFSSHYCGNMESAFTDSTEKQLKVQECIYHENDTNPYPYPYHETTINQDGGERWINEDSNPFLAEHACCSTLGEYLGPDTQCYHGEIGCYPHPQEWQNIVRGYVQTKEVAYCTGERGNVCDENSVFELVLNDVGQFICGNYEYQKECKEDADGGIDEHCQGQVAFGIVDFDSDGDGTNDDVGWCSGTMGCSEICTGPIVALNEENIGSDGNFIAGASLNHYAKIQSATENDDNGNFRFSCGCDHPDASGKPMDSDHDGIFEGTCDVVGIGS
jgi:hypothetical protein